MQQEPPPAPPPPVVVSLFVFHASYDYNHYSGSEDSTDVFSIWGDISSQYLA